MSDEEEDLKKQAIRLSYAKRVERKRGGPPPVTQQDRDQIEEFIKKKGVTVLPTRYRKDA